MLPSWFNENVNIIRTVEAVHSNAATTATTILTVDLQAAAFIEFSYTGLIGTTLSIVGNVTEEIAIIDNFGGISSGTFSSLSSVSIIGLGVGTANLELRAVTETGAPVEARKEVISNKRVGLFQRGRMEFVQEQGLVSRGDAALLFDDGLDIEGGDFVEGLTSGKNYSVIAVERTDRIGKRVFIAADLKQLTGKRL